MGDSETERLKRELKEDYASQDVSFDEFIHNTCVKHIELNGYLTLGDIMTVIAELYQEINEDRIIRFNREDQVFEDISNSAQYDTIDGLDL